MYVDGDDKNGKGNGNGNGPTGGEPSLGDYTPPADLPIPGIEDDSIPERDQR